MASLPTVMILGHLGSAPAMSFTPNGNPVTSFPVATNRIYTTAEGERKTETEWFNVVTWNKLAEQCNQFLSKGRLVYAEGRLRTSTWEGQDGQKHYRTEIIASRITFLDRQVAGPLAEEKNEEGASGDLEAEDVPFQSSSN